jgi:hypothetical protein
MILVAFCVFGFGSPWIEKLDAQEMEKEQSIILVSCFFFASMLYNENGRTMEFVPISSSYWLRVLMVLHFMFFPI